MKIIDRYIFKSFLERFLVIFIILTFLMVLQSIWLYISEFAGKDLELSIILKSILYSIPVSVPLTLPLSILFTSIMVFGDFSEHYEFAAMKSTGISLSRAIRFLSIFILFLGFSTYFFANSVIPASYREFVNLRRNVVQLKPARAIVANQFNDLGVINIKVKRKYGDNDQFLDDVIIHKQNPSKSGNFTVIKSEKGELVSSINSNVLSLILTNGYYYDEIKGKSISQRKKHPFVKSEFKYYKINLDLSSFNKGGDISEKNYAKNRKALNIDMLSKDIDSFSIALNKDRISFKNRNYKNIGAHSIYQPVTLACETKEFPNSILDIVGYQKKIDIVDRAMSDIKQRLSNITSHEVVVNKHNENLNKFEIALHEKYALGVACIVLFFIGAPIGAIIRKGGLGLPTLYAFGLFIIYYFLGLFLKNTAEDGSISPFIATWLSTLIFFPLGIIFTYQAATDKSLINLGELGTKIKKIFKKDS